MRGLSLACTCVRGNTVCIRDGERKLRHPTETCDRKRIFIFYVLILHWHPHKALRQAGKLCYEILPDLASFVHPLTHSLTLCNPSVHWERRWGGVDDYFHFQGRLWCFQTLPVFICTPTWPSFAPASCCSSSLFDLRLPPGEEGSSALETLRVGLAVGSLRRSGRLHNYWGHLD